MFKEKLLNTNTQQTFRKKNTIFYCFHIYCLFIISLMISPRNVELPPRYGQFLTLGV